MSAYLDNLRPFEKRVVFGVAVLLFIVLNFWFVFPRFSDLANTKIRRREAEKKLADYQAEIRQIPLYERQVKELESENLGVPPEEQAIQFSRAIQSQQAQSGVNIISTGKQTTRTNQFFLEISQTINVQAREEQLVNFLYNLGSGNSLIRVRELSLKADQPRHQLNANVTLVASFQKKPAARAPAPSPAATKTAAAGVSPPLSTAKRP
ncbi:MAG TPA: GspMb/PilO family protein [Candidatus Paceibacterota bacterium]|nr:GspMb/PilO family protein [Candidatus Paceibacterota bacterium]HRT57924.1 GspMb/PilO family protein [Candidatus Paceibacterota bacterium]